MSTITIIIIAILAWSFYKGYGKGIINRIGAILGFFLAYNFTGALFGAVHTYLVDHDFLNPETSKYITYGLTFILIIVLVRVLASLIVRVLKLLGINIVNKFAGGAVNVLIWAMLLSITVYFATDVHILDSKVEETDPILPHMYDFGSALMKKFFN